MESYIATTQEELEKVYAFRYDVFVAEQGKRISHADHLKKLLVDPIDAVADQICVADNTGAMIGSLRAVRGLQNATQSMWRNYSLEEFATYPPEKFSFTGRLFVLPERRGSAALMHLLRKVYQCGRVSGVTIDFIFCTPSLVALYQQLGYRRYRSAFEDPDLGFQIPMVLIANDEEHLKRVRSPFVQWMSEFENSDVEGNWLRRAYTQYANDVSALISDQALFFSYLGRVLSEKPKGVLQDLSVDEIGLLYKEGSIFSCSAGDRILRKGDPGAEMFVLLKGAAEVVIANDGQSRVLGTVGEGDALGEMALVTNAPRIADVVAVCECDLIALTERAIDRLVKSEPVLMCKFFRNMSRGLAERLTLSTQRKPDAGV